MLRELGMVVGFLSVMVFQEAVAQPLKILTIGDSLTEEYRFEGVFSGPKVEGVPVPVANTRNWVEIVADRRADRISFGSFDANFNAYSDFRNGGYAHNFGVPSFTTTDWLGVINWESLPNDGLAYKYAAYRTYSRLVEHLEEEGIGVVVIFLGGNDLKSDYSGTFHDDPPPALLQNVVTNLGQIISFVRQQNATVPIVVCTLPDIGATPVITSNNNYEDLVLRARARQRIADTNAAVMSLAASRGAHVARIDLITTKIFDEPQFHLNGTVFQYPPDDLNPPDHIFCHDGFHPSTVGQALIGNLVLDAINRATGAAVPLMGNREILGDVLGLDPDQPYLTWAGSAGGATANPDGDGFPNLVEYLLGGSPSMADDPFTFAVDGGLSFRPLEVPSRYADLAVQESGTLGNDWAVVPQSRITVLPDGTWQVAPTGGSKNFYRLTATPKP
ncbi:GDSL-type esterase/lipase family protein [Luteolibacter sp. SL250]|uniref:SGNH/GDSL hydrolase family protein n=1 Tax=Luteolibacter sp. SL250 TaxID=2995170 RepID=UPI002272189C|nr:SGNH/GDSL hydrolase family protein [Luteolibacter sp. SL250]WAC19297.1 GDSL-type esterase/lipase family protein [Luteolibacter sp. SL250]